MMSFDFVVQNENGLHTRPGAQFVKSCKAFAADVTVFKGERSANAKSLMKLMGLGVCQGDAIHVEVTGQDERDAFEQIRSVLENLRG